MFLGSLDNAYFGRCVLLGSVFTVFGRGALESDCLGFHSFNSYVVLEKLFNSLASVSLGVN